MLWLKVLSPDKVACEEVWTDKEARAGEYGAMVAGNTIYNANAAWELLTGKRLFTNTKAGGGWNSPVLAGEWIVGAGGRRVLPANKPGSGIVSAGGSSIGVDYSLAAGAEAVVVMVGKAATGKLGGKFDPQKTKVQTIAADGTVFQILTVSPTGKHPEPRAEAGKVTLGAQTISFDGKNIRFGTIAPSPKLKM